MEQAGVIDDCLFQFYANQPQGIRGRTAVVAPPFAAFVSRLSSSRSSGNSAGIPVVCRGRPAPACVSSGSWVSCHYPAGSTVLPGRQGRPAASNRARSGGTSGTASACRRGAGCRPVRGLSYGSAVHRARVYARTRCKAGAFSHHASPHRTWCRQRPSQTGKARISPTAGEGVASVPLPYVRRAGTARQGGTG